MRYPNRWIVGEWTFYEVTDHGLSSYGNRPLFAFGDGSRDDRGRPKFGGLYVSLEHAMVAAVGEKYTGPRGAGGTGVGTAADWFMKMIGAEDLVTVDYQSGRKALAEALASTSMSTNGPHSVRAGMLSDELEARGLVLATKVDPPRHQG